MNRVITLNEFIIEKQKDFPYSTGELTGLLSDIGVAAKIVNREVNKAGLVNILGATENSNIQGETQQKLDVYANHQFVSAFRSGAEVAAIASEEEEGICVYDNEISRDAKYVVAFDPLDGSSNIDVNVSIGTIFSIYRRVTKGVCTREDFLQKGMYQVAAGYVIYGSSTMLVFTTGNGVNGFTLDPSIGEFCLSHPNLKTPENGSIYSINEGHYNDLPEGIKQYLNWCKESNKADKRPYSARYIGSMVADFHRNLIKGGVFIYPQTAHSPNGKLRLLYECNPMAFIAEQAGGKASTGKQRVLELQPTALHQRVPIIIGSKKMVEKVEQMLEQFSPVSTL